MKKVIACLMVLLLLFVIVCAKSINTDRQPIALSEKNIKPDSSDKIVMAWDKPIVGDDHDLPRGVNVLAPVWINVEEDESGKPYASLTELDYQGYVYNAHQQGIEVWVTVSSYNPGLNEQIVKDAKICRKICHSINAFVCSNDVDGVCLDFENMNPANKKDYTAFVSYLTEMLPADVKVSACVSVQLDNDENNWYQCYDHKGLADACDYICLMAYDQFYITSDTAGPVAGLDWTEEKLQRELVDVPGDKLILGIPFYYYAYPYSDNTPLWPDTDISIFTWTVLKSIEDTGKYTDKHNNIIIPEFLEDRIDEVSGMRFMKFRDQYGITRVCYADTDDSLAARCNLSSTYNLKGVAVWQAAFGTEEQWTLLNQHVKK